MTLGKESRNMISVQELMRPPGALWTAEIRYSRVVRPVRVRG